MLKGLLDMETTNQTNVFNKTETDSQIQRTSGYQWGERSGEGQDRSRGLRGTNYYAENK